IGRLSRRTSRAPSLRSGQAPPSAPNQLTFWGLGAPSGPLSQSCSDEMFGIPHWCPFHPLNPSIRKAQNPVTLSLITMSPSALRIRMPNDPLFTPPSPLPSGGPALVPPASCAHPQV